jgi:hypothetical protein
LGKLELREQGRGRKLVQQQWAKTQRRGESKDDVPAPCQLPQRKKDIQSLISTHESGNQNLKIA